MFGPGQDARPEQGTQATLEAGQSRDTSQQGKEPAVQG